MGNQSELLPPTTSTDEDVIWINERCSLRTSDGYRVVSVGPVVLTHYAVDDRTGEAHAMVMLVVQGCAQQNEVARAFKCSERTVRRHQRRFEKGGLSALGRGPGYPKGRSRLKPSRERQVDRWKREGVANREIARRLGVDEKAVRVLLRRLGWKPRTAEQLALPGVRAETKVSAHNSGSDSDDEEDDPGPRANAQPEPVATPPSAEAKVSAQENELTDEVVTLDSNPADRSMDRVLACFGLLDDAAPMFREGQDVPGLGVLLALPALIESGVFEIARDLYGSLGPAFYGLRTTVVALLLMALLRIKRPENIKEHSPETLGRLLGLDRAPEVKTLRRKLTRLAAFGRATQFGRALAERRVATRGHAMGFLYVDGHVRVYHGQRELPKTHVARMRLSMPATTDYWVNDAEGEPLLLVTTEANKALVQMLPAILEQVRSLVGERRVTIVFDRGGWSPKLFKKLVAEGFDVLTYRKGRSRRVPKRCFTRQTAIIEGQAVAYELADQGVRLLGGTLRLRQVTRLKDSHQTPIITSRRDLSACEVAYRMFERWRQENFFKYLREEYALDALVDYGTEAADATREVPNPARKALNAKLREAFADLAQAAAELGLEATDNEEALRRTMRGFKIANAALAKRISAALNKISALEKRRAKVPTRVPIGMVANDDVIKLRVECKHLTDLFKMVAYQAESELVKAISPHYGRAEDEARTLVQSALAAAGNLEVTDTHLRVHIRPLSSPHRTAALRSLCAQLNAASAAFPGTKLRVDFDVQQDPAASLAFPGARRPRAQAN